MVLVLRKVPVQRAYVAESMPTYRIGTWIKSAFSFEARIVSAWELILAHIGSHGSYDACRVRAITHASHKVESTHFLSLGHLLVRRHRGRIISDQPHGPRSFSCIWLGCDKVKRILHVQWVFGSWRRLLLLNQRGSSSTHQVHQRGKLAWFRRVNRRELPLSSLGWRQDAQRGTHVCVTSCRSAVTCESTLIGRSHGHSAAFVERIGTATSGHRCLICLLSSVLLLEITFITPLSAADRLVGQTPFDFVWSEGHSLSIVEQVCIGWHLVFVMNYLADYLFLERCVFVWAKGRPVWVGVKWGEALGRLGRIFVSLETHGLACDDGRSRFCLVDGAGALVQLVGAELSFGVEASRLGRIHGCHK